jgi:hypothetical protein
MNPSEMETPLHADATADTNALAESWEERLVDSDAAMAAVPSEQDCCLCEYQELPECERRYDEKMCYTLVAETNQRDCVWKSGRCTSRFLVQCGTWRSQVKNQCRAPVRIQSRDAADPARGLKACGRLRLRHEGHGRDGCRTLASRVIVCIAKLPLCTEYWVDDGSCSTFANLIEARMYMERIASRLGGSQVVHISANQCTASAVCQSRYYFDIIARQVTGSPAACAHEEDLCHRDSETAECLEQGRATTQTCCCGTGVCTWWMGLRSCRGDLDHPTPSSPEWVAEVKRRAANDLGASKIIGFKPIAGTWHLPKPLRARLGQFSFADTFRAFRILVPPKVAFLIIDNERAVAWLYDASGTEIARGRVGDDDQIVWTSKPVQSVPG